MPAYLKFKPSTSQDVSYYQLYYKSFNLGDSLTKDNADNIINLGMRTPDPNGFIIVELSGLPGLANLDGQYDLGIAAVDDAGNISPLLTEGLLNIDLDFLAPSPPSEASVYWA